MKNTLDKGRHGASDARDANVYSSLQFGSVQDSIENLFSAAKNSGLHTPMPPKFRFSERRGRLNWRQIMQADAEKITSDVDLRALEALLQNITYARVEREDIDRFGDENFLKLFKLS